MKQRILRAESAFLLSALCLLLSALNCGRAERPPSTGSRGPGSATPKSLEAKDPKAPRVAPVARDLPQITSGGTLRVLFTFNSTGYFIYRGETMGYEYELMSRYAASQKLKLVPVVLRDSTLLFNTLNRGEGDVVAAQLVAPANETQVLVTDALYATPPAIVQRAERGPATGQTPATATALAKEERETAGPPITVRARLISRPAELAGERVDVSRSSPYRRQLLELNNELGDVIEVVETEQSTDRLIQRLSAGEIGFTVAAENVATLKATEYSNLVVKPMIGPPLKVVWAVRRNAPMLHDSLNRWLAQQRSSGLMTVLYRKYFQDRRAFAQRASSRYLTAKTGHLSPFDEWFREYARVPGWDWRLVASQAYQESRFNPSARSWAGAIGVMQIMPRTARELKINPADPRQNIEGACRYLWKLDDQLKSDIPREEERIKFILGSYNVGLGHVQDARRLAEKNGDDPRKWDDVAYWLIRKSKRNVYSDPVVKYGFARGTEPVNYVGFILERLEHYKGFVTTE